MKIQILSTLSAIALFSVFIISCSSPDATPVPTKSESAAPSCDYLNVPSTSEYASAGIQMIELAEGYKVWTKRFGNSPMKVLLLHGGPAATHEYMECFESFFPSANIEFYHYDQLGSYYSDQPDDDSLWTIERFVEEVEQVRIALGLDSDNFYLLGNSWGGILAMEYALKYQQNLKGLIVCNMTADFDKYEAYNSKLRASMRPSLIDSLSFYENNNDYMNPVYVDLVQTEYYEKHICRSKIWPESVGRSFGHLNQHVYELMQGPSEFVPGGILKGWSVWDRLSEITTPTLTVGAKYDTMNPEEMEEMSTLFPNGHYLYCSEGSHLAMWDDQEHFMPGVIGFIHGVHDGSISKK